MTATQPGPVAVVEHQHNAADPARLQALPFASPVGSAGRRKPAGRLRAFRPDIEGLRALAVLVVVGYHAGIPGLSGGFVGVDVFFVISGFLITRQLLGELAGTGLLNVLRFWARRIRRLMPAAALVTIVTVLAGWALFDPLRFRRLTVDAIYTAGYAANWHLASAGTDYLTATQEPSALQHYWSLAVEEQYYLLWPLILLAIAAATRRAAPGLRMRAVTVVLGVGTAASFAVCAWQTQASQPWAYFGLHARAWELGVGGLLAVAAQQLSRLRGPAAAALSWLGVVCVLGAVISFDADTVFPGLAATLPVLGAALIIAGGCAAPLVGAELLLGRSLPQLLGGLSYGWYLWHWPAMLLAPAVVGHALDLRHRILVCFIALGLAALSYALIEHPIRRIRWPEVRPARFVGVGGALSGAVAGVAIGALLLWSAPVGSGASVQAADLSPASAPGNATPSVAARVDAALLDGLATNSVPANLTPALASATTTVPKAQLDGCHASFGAVTPQTSCVYGDRAANRTIVLFGDSHALQWFPALDRIARAAHYQLVSLTKSSCTPFTLTIYNETLNRPYSECDTWRSRAILAIGQLHPSLVVVSSLTGVLDHGLDGGGAAFDRTWADGARETVTELRRTGSRIDVIDDTTNPGGSVPECLAVHLNDASACNYYRAGGLFPPGRRAAQAAAVTAAGATDINPTGWLCPSGRCPVVVGNLLVFRDEQHLSTAYVSWLATPLRERLVL